MQDDTREGKNRKRVLVKFSGEALASSVGYGIDSEVLKYVAGEIKQQAKQRQPHQTLLAHSDHTRLYRTGQDHDVPIGLMVGDVDRRSQIPTLLRNRNPYLDAQQRTSTMHHAVR